MAKFPSTGGATRREFARIIIEARGDTGLSCTPDPFTDVTCAANPNDGKYVQKMKDIGITSGCGGGAYCPDAQTQRDQSAVFFLKGEASHCPLNVNGCTYTPPSCTTTHVFADVPCPSQYADWVGQLYFEGVTVGCGGNNFCPTAALGSWQMLAWANKIWGSYAPLPRASVLTYRDEGGRVSTEANQALATGDSSAVMVYPRDNIFLGSQLVASAAWIGTTPNYQFFAVDHLGTPRLVTDIAANPVGDPPQLRKFWPYGDDAAMSGPESGQQLKLAGMQRDLETEHYYDHARTEDFSIGRFLSPDLLGGEPGDPQSWNRYAYVMNNPMTLTDPMGFDQKCKDPTHCEDDTTVTGHPIDADDAPLPYVPTRPPRTIHGGGGGGVGHFSAGGFPGSPNNDAFRPCGTGDAVSDERIAKLDSRIQDGVRDLVNMGNIFYADRGVNFRVSEGVRSYAHQDLLYLQGRPGGLPGPMVTNARGGQSAHNFYLGFDLVPISGGRVVNIDWGTMGQLGESMGFEWGGRYHPPDWGHFQNLFGATLRQLDAHHGC